MEVVVVAVVITDGGDDDDGDAMIISLLSFFATRTGFFRCNFIFLYTEIYRDTECIEIKYANRECHLVRLAGKTILQ